MSSAVAVLREGSGPEVLLVHGGASPATTWAGLESLRDRWTLASLHRRGYPPSPEPDDRQDFEVDGADILTALDGGRPHVVAHSYGGVGALIAAAREPGSMRSLTLIEPAVFIPAEDPEVARFRDLGDEVLTRGLDTDPARLREFLAVAGSPVPDGPLPEAVERSVRRAHGNRPPGEATLDLPAVRDSGIPCLVASGDHTGFLERSADTLAAEIGAERAVAPGAGHFVAAAPGFPALLERFLLANA